MSRHEYHLIAIGWSAIILMLTVFWLATLRRLAEVLKQRLEETRSRQTFKGIPGVFMFLIRGEFKETGDQRIMDVCERLRKLLYGYMGATAAYVVFIVIMQSRY